MIVGAVPASRVSSCRPALPAPAHWASPLSGPYRLYCWHPTVSPFASTPCRGRIRCMPPPPRSRWSLVIPVKVLALAKSRLTGLAGPRRAELALAMAADTVAAAVACPVSGHGDRGDRRRRGGGRAGRPGRRHRARPAGRRAQRGAGVRRRARRIPLAGPGPGGLAADLPALGPGRARPSAAGGGRDGRRRSWPTPRARDHAVHRPGRGPRSARGSARGRAPGTGLPGRGGARPCPAWHGLRRDVDDRRTCAERGPDRAGTRTRPPPRG